VGGWADSLFGLIGQFARGEMNADHLVGIIKKIDLDGATLNEQAEELEMVSFSISA
jgi:hypothetical protein